VRRAAKRKTLYVIIYRKPIPLTATIVILIIKWRRILNIMWRRLGYANHGQKTQCPSFHQSAALAIFGREPR
jgi:hypothetical protein